MILIGNYTGPDYVFTADPGKQTGWTLYHVPDNKFTSGEEPWLDLSSRADKWLEQLGPNVGVGVENFIITAVTARDTQAPWSLENIGSLEYLATKHQCRDFVKIAMSSSKNLFTNDKLKMLGWYRPGKGHANDAARILGLYLANNGWWPDTLRIDDDDEQDDMVRPAISR
jgi:hypothetical protein